MDIQSENPEVQFNFTREDISQHFDNKHAHHEFKLLAFDEHGKKRDINEIKRLMRNISKQVTDYGFDKARTNLPRDNLTREQKGKIVNSITSYLKKFKKIHDEKSKEYIKEVLIQDIPEYLKKINIQEIQKYLISKQSQESYKFLEKKIKEHERIPFFYNFLVKYKALQEEREYEESHTRSNDYRELYQTHESSFQTIYKEFFKQIDPKCKFMGENEPVIDAFYGIFKEKENENNHHVNKKTPDNILQYNKEDEAEIDQIPVEDEYHVGFNQTLEMTQFSDILHENKKKSHNNIPKEHNTMGSLFE